MWFTKLWALIFPTAALAFHRNTVEFSANYFKERNVPFVCLMTCGNFAWDVRFTKAASVRSISVSKLNTNYSESYESFRHCLQQLHTRIGVLMDAHCLNDGMMDVLDAASKRRWLDSTHIWLIVDETVDLYTNKSTENITHAEYRNSENFSKILKIFSVLNVSIDADIIIASKYGDRYKFFDVFNFGKEQGGNVVVTEIGTWKLKGDNKQLIQELNRYKYYRRWDFGQARLRIMSVSTSNAFDPKMLTSVVPVAGLTAITRTSTLILSEIAEIFNIKFVHSRTDKWLGTYEQNASRAVATSIFFREQDVSSVFRYLESLYDRVLLIHPALTSIETRYFYRIPTTGPGKFENLFLHPLSAGTWYSLLVMSAICTVILIFATRLEARPSPVQYAFFSVAASVCQQNFEGDISDLTLRRVSAARKLTMFVTGIACVLIYNYYTSSVVSWLLNGPPPSINSLEELIDSNLEVIFEDVGYTHSWLTVPGYYFNKANAKYEDIIKKRVLSRKRTTPLFVPLEQGVAMVKAGGYAYLTEASNANYLISQTFNQDELCELDSLISIEKVLLYPGVQKNSPYKEFLTWGLTRLLERGIVSCVQRRTAPPSVACRGSSPRALALGGAAPAFILLAFGYLLAFGIMMFERLFHKMKLRS